MLGELALTGLFENLLHEIGDIFWYGEVGIFDSERDFQETVKVVVIEEGLTEGFLEVKLEKHKQYSGSKEWVTIAQSFMIFSVHDSVKALHEETCRERIVIQLFLLNLRNQIQYLCLTSLWELFIDCFNCTVYSICRVIFIDKYDMNWLMSGFVSIMYQLLKPSVEFCY